MTKRSHEPGKLLSYLCLVTAIVNIGGNVLLAFVYRPVFAWLRVPPPLDPRQFAIELALSFLMGVVALSIFTSPSPAVRVALLKIGALGKGLYALVGLYFHSLVGLHWFFLIFVAWDIAFVVVFLLYWVQLESYDLFELQQRVATGGAGSRTGKALLLGFSLTGNGRQALTRLKKGLEAAGYARVDEQFVVAKNPIYAFPMSFMSFVKILARAYLRRPTEIEPPAVSEHHDYDLIVVESPTWLLGMAAPVEAVFQNEATRKIFEGRDTAVLVVCRGAFRRTLAMVGRWLQLSGGQLVATRGFVHQGVEPRRLFSLWLYLIFRRAGFPPLIAEPHYGLSDDSLMAVESFGRELAQRSQAKAPPEMIARGAA